MQRRDIIALIGAAALAGPHAAIAQSSDRARRIGVLMPSAENDPETNLLGAEFRRRLQELGWNGGRNLRITYRWGAGDASRIHAYAAELVALAPDVIFAGGAAAVAALHQATRSIPIVFVSVSDPAGQGFVASLAKPGGNLTGITNFAPSQGGEWLKLLKQIAPGVRRVSVMYNPQTAPYADAFMRSVEAAAASQGMTAAAAQVRDDTGLEAAIAAAGREAGGGLIVPSDAFSYSRSDKIVALAARNKVPAVYAFRVFTAGGGLLSYGVDLSEEMHQAAAYIDRILTGTAPGDLPVLPPSKFELVINARTARELGLTVPATLLARADEVIE